MTSVCSLPSLSPKNLAARLRGLGRFELDRMAGGTIAGRLNGVRLACHHYPYPLLEATDSFAAARVAGTLDLGAMPHLLRSIAYFEDADSDPMPRMLAETSWEDVKGHLAGEAERAGQLLF